MNMIKLPSGRMVAWRDDGSGPPVVLLHAFPLDSGMWAPQMAALAARYRVVAPDLPGFGGSDPSPSWTIDTAADGLAEWLDAAGIPGPITLGGLSMGGYVALAFARRHASRLKGLILADTKAEPDDDTAREGRTATLKLVQESGARGLMKSMLAKVLGVTTREHRPDVLDTVNEIGEWQSVAAITAAVVALRDRPDARPGLAAVAVSTLVLVGAEDTITPLANAQTMASQIPNAILTTIPAAGHLANLEAPAEFNAAVESFLLTIHPTA
jgi:3-oxoadipate enol-lactonase